MEPLPNPPASGMDPTKKLETDGISVFTIQYQNKGAGWRQWWPSSRFEELFLISGHHFQPCRGKNPSAGDQ
jgi:hypothetical protein